MTYSQIYYSKHKEQIKKKKYYLSEICKDCGKKITFEHIRCVNCQRFNELYKNYIKTKKYLKHCEKFLIWFTGFWEGEGTVKAYKRNYKLRNGEMKEYIGFKIAVFQKETYNLFKIKKILKIGEVYKVGLKNVCSVWSTDSLGTILALTNAMKPFIISPRRKLQLKRFFNYSKIRSIRKRL